MCAFRLSQTAIWSSHLWRVELRRLKSTTHRNSVILKPFCLHGTLLNFFSRPISKKLGTFLNCSNKSRMQKMTEISVFLLNKGTFPSQAMEHIRQLGQTMTEERQKRLEALRKEMPPNLSKVWDNNNTSFLLKCIQYCSTQTTRLYLLTVHGRWMCCVWTKSFLTFHVSQINN